MENIKKHIENYGFNITQINNDKGYYCKNNTSKSEFILDFSPDNLNQSDIINENYKNTYNKKIQVVFLIQVNNNIDEILELIQNEKIIDQQYQYLIYDKNEEMEFFLKDLWNVILGLERK